MRNGLRDLLFSPPLPDSCITHLGFIPQMQKAGMAGAASGMVAVSAPGESAIFDGKRENYGQQGAWKEEQATEHIEADKQTPAQQSRFLDDPHPVENVMHPAMVHVVD
jgi:hypothetical protein